MFDKWIAISLAQMGVILLSSFVVYTAILLYTRMVGLRSFSKMTASDFAMTIAVGSLFGATISSPSPTLLMGLFAILCVFVGQWTLAVLRRKSSFLSKLVDNQPLLLMTRSEILHENLERANMTESDLFGKLREANAFHLDQIIAVVFETTGDVSVIHSTQESPKLSSCIFDNVIGGEHVNKDGCQSPSSVIAIEIPKESVETISNDEMRKKAKSIRAAVKTIAVALHSGTGFSSNNFQHGSSVRPSSWFDRLLNTEPSPPITGKYHG